MINPIYIDGPLKGEDHPIPSSAGIPWPKEGGGYVHYKIRKFGFASGTEAVFLYLGYCSFKEPGAMDVAWAILSEQAMKRAQKHNTGDSWATE